MKIVLVDHQDSFTWNLAHDLGELTGALPEVVDSRRVDVAALRDAPPDLIVLSPGPGHPANPADAGRSLELVRACAGRVPIFGVCLGHQLIAVAFGGNVVRAPEPVHGKSSPVLHDGTGLFAGLPSPVAMMRYHSLVAERATLPRELRVTARSPRDEILALEHVRWPVWGVQFHPESVGSPLGGKLLANVVAQVREREELIVAVLAAGRSSRMGFPKALADLGGELALERELRIARSHSLATLVVLGFHADEIRSGAAFGAARVVVNPAPERGQSSSVREAARAIGDGKAMGLWPVDHARVSEATFARLLGAFRARPPGIALVVPSFKNRRGHPLFADAAACRELAELADDEPAHVVVRRDPRRVLHVEVDDPMVLADFDRPDDLNATRSRVSAP